MPDFHMGRQQITISYNCMYQIHNNIPNHCLSFSKLPYFNSAMLLYIIVMQPKQL